MPGGGRGLLTASPSPAHKPQPQQQAGSMVRATDRMTCTCKQCFLKRLKRLAATGQCMQTRCLPQCGAHTVTVPGLGSSTTDRSAASQLAHIQPILSLCIYLHCPSAFASPHQLVNAVHLQVHLPHRLLGGLVHGLDLFTLGPELLRGRAVLLVELTQRCIEGVHHADGYQVAVALSLGQLQNRTPGVEL